MLAQVELEDPGAHGVIFAQGSRFGGHAMFIKDGRLHYTYNFRGLGDEQTLVADLPDSGAHIFGIDFGREGVDEQHQPVGTTTLHIDDRAVGEMPMRMMAIQFSLCGEGLRIGYDGGGLPVNAGLRERVRAAGAPGPGTRRRSARRRRR